MADPVEFVVKKLPYDLSSHGGLALVGRLFKRINLPAMIDPQYPVRGGIANSDILKCYLGLLTLGKNDFEAVEGFRSQRFVHQALGLRAVPSSATLRQRFDAMGTEWSALADQINCAVLGLHINGSPIDFGALSTGHLPLDIDTFVMDQSDTAKEGVSYTYAGVDGYCPIALYLGTRGYCLELDLRAGSQHSACESEYNIERALGTACAVSAAPLLLRADSGFCSQHLITRTLEQAARLTRQVDLLIKWNPRSAPVEAIAAQRCADTATVWTQPREGKRECLWQEALTPIALDKERSRALRRVYRLTERSIDRRGNALLLPEYVLEGWTTTLGPEIEDEQIIALYRDHATHEQFHAEFKTDMALNRLPSGKFATNHLVCALAAVAMNLLRIVGQHTLHEGDSPLRKAALRRRIKTVMQEMMYKAARIISHARGWVLGISGSDSGFAVFERALGRMKAA
ncbi:IS1380 family transposase [Limnohabitans sp.]